MKASFRVKIEVKHQMISFLWQIRDTSNKTESDTKEQNSVTF